MEFLRENRIGVIATLLPDGAPHGATVHYAQTEGVLRLYVLTERSSRKCSGLLEGGVKRASFVIGFVEGGATLQFDGAVRLITDATEFENAKQVYRSKFDTKDEFFADPDAVLLELTPDWWQFTDYRVSPKQRASGTL